MLARKISDARHCGKEGRGTHRNSGDCGLVGLEMVRLHQVAVQRGLDVGPAYRAEK